MAMPFIMGLIHFVEAYIGAFQFSQFIIDNSAEFALF